MGEGDVERFAGGADEALGAAKGDDMVAGIEVAVEEEGAVVEVLGEGREELLEAGDAVVGAAPGEFGGL